MDLPKAITHALCGAMLIVLAPAQLRAEETAAPRASGFLAAPPVSEEVLGEHRGAAATTNNDQQLSATVGSNSAVNVTTGVNAITEGALGNSTGFPTVIQNSGNNVSIQNATILNLQLR